MARSAEELNKTAAEYRAMAGDAMQQAQNTASPQTRQEFLKIAHDWLDMARKVERG